MTSDVILLERQVQFSCNGKVECFLCDTYFYCIAWAGQPCCCKCSISKWLTHYDDDYHKHYTCHTSGIISALVIHLMCVSQCQCFTPATRKRVKDFFHFMRNYSDFILGSVCCRDIGDLHSKPPERAMCRHRRRTEVVATALLTCCL